MPSPEPLRIALVGLRGSGKSTLGRLLAEELGLDFRDLDLELLPLGTVHGNPGEFLSAVGLAAFRQAESQALERLAQGDLPFVLATGGGAVEGAENRRLLRERCFTLWLQAAPRVLAARIAADPTPRPPLLPSAEARLTAAGALAESREMLARRGGWYREVARGELDTTGLDPAEALRRLRALLPGPA